MRQFTTPTITAHIEPKEILTGATEVYIFVRQDATGETVAAGQVFGAVIDPDAGTVSYTLSRNETKAFSVGTALVQVTGKTNNKYWATDIKKIYVKRNLNYWNYEEWISGEESAVVSG